jgi:hypothetical protein
MNYRVIQWATGGVGRAAIQGIVRHPELELVGCWVHGRSKDGRDAGELADVAPLGIKATRDVDALLALDADCVLQPDPRRRGPHGAHAPRGKEVVTPLGWSLPVALAGRRGAEAACHGDAPRSTARASIPGGITERFRSWSPRFGQRHARPGGRVLRTSARTMRPTSSATSCFRKTPEEAAQSPMVQFLANGFFQSIDMVAAELRVELDPEKTTRHELAVATEPIDSPIGPIPPGRVAAHRFTWEATVGGVPFMTVRTNWFMGQEHLDPPWTFGPEGERFEVEVQGDPPVKLTFHGLHPASIEEGLKRNRGIVATAMHCVNAIPYVCRNRASRRTSICRS